MTTSRKTKILHHLGRMIDGYGKHQKWWWIGLGFLMLGWFGYDVGRLVTRADLLSGSQNVQGNITVDEVIQKSEEGSGRLIVVSRDAARFIDREGRSWYVPFFSKQATMDHLEKIQKNGVLIDGKFNIDIRPVKIQPSELLMSSMADLLIKALFVLVYGLALYFLMRFLRGNPGRFKKINPEKPLASILDVAGYDGIKQELLEVVDYLKDPEKFDRVGARPPRGVLLYGPPGNGKTLLAKAVAGEAQASFFEQSASSFIQIYAGAGAKAVRSLFEAARSQAPAVVFIDEIDAVGGARSGSGTHDERLQTLNAILTEMDGFADNRGIVVVAATNRLESLDEALVRPGRFDRKVFINVPSLNDRELILLRHAEKIKVDDTVDWKHWAQQTKGFSGADLAAFVNEAAIEAARRSSEKVTQEDLVKARDRVLMGAKNHGQFLSEKERNVVAVHEMGHAFMRLSVGGRVEKVSISPRGQALGVTVSVAEDDLYLYSKDDIEKEIKVCLAGKAAEIAVFGEATTGAFDDLQKASALARSVSSHLGSKKWGTYIPSHEKNVDLFEEEAAEYLNKVFEECLVFMKKHRKALLTASERLQQTEDLHESDILSFWQNDEKAPVLP